MEKNGLLCTCASPSSDITRRRKRRWLFGSKWENFCPPPDRKKWRAAPLLLRLWKPLSYITSCQCDLHWRPIFSFSALNGKKALECDPVHPSFGMRFIVTSHIPTSALSCSRLEAAHLKFSAHSPNLQDFISLFGGCHKERGLASFFLKKPLEICPFSP